MLLAHPSQARFVTSTWTSFWWWTVCRLPCWKPAWWSEHPVKNFRKSTRCPLPNVSFDYRTHWHVANCKVIFSICIVKLSDTPPLRLLIKMEVRRVCSWSRRFCTSWHLRFSAKQLNVKLWSQVGGRCVPLSRKRGNTRLQVQRQLIKVPVLQENAGAIKFLTQIIYTA